MANLSGPADFYVAWEKAFSDAFGSAGVEATSVAPVSGVTGYQQEFLTRLMTCLLKGSASSLSGGRLAIAIEEGIRTGDSGVLRIVVAATGAESHPDAFLFGSGHVSTVADRLNLLAAYVLAHQAGGKVSRQTKGDHRAVILELPLERDSGSRSKEPWNLPPNLFRAFELW
jgi:hypothetical protein